MASRFERYLKKQGSVVERALNRFLPSPKLKPAVIHEAMRYSVEAGGKRLRPILVMVAADLCGGRGTNVLPAACAMELVHTYSLVHDDLPAMDDDDLRRGRPTNHKVFGEDIAILAGDALLTYAFELLAKNLASLKVTAPAVVEATRILAQSAGTQGMIGGQVADIKADKGRWKKLKGGEFKTAPELLSFVHLNKTAALIIGSLDMGAALSGASNAQRSALKNYGRAIGLAFQIQDDILDRIGDKKKLGKKGSDIKNQKLTYPALYGLPASQKHCLNLIKQAHRSLRIFGDNAWVLHDLADFIISRDH